MAEQCNDPECPSLEHPEDLHAHGSNMFVVSFDNCVRCGLAHAGLVTKPFERPVAPPDAPHVWTHWTTCPTNGDPVLVMRTSPTPIPPGCEAYEGTWDAEQIALAKQRDTADRGTHFADMLDGIIKPVVIVGRVDEPLTIEQLYPICGNHLRTMRDRIASLNDRIEAAEWLIDHGFDKHHLMRDNVTTMLFDLKSMQWQKIDDDLSK